MENDDATAEAINQYFAEAGICPGVAVLWNIYPWYINREPKAAELEAGLEPLARLIELLPRLSVVMLHGCSAQKGWKRFVRRHPEFETPPRLHVISTYHTSRQA